MCRRANAFNRLLRDAVKLDWWRDPDHLVKRGHNVNHMSELLAKPTAILDPRGPRHNHRVSGTPKVTGDLLGPLKRRVHRVRPSRREVVEVFRPPEFVDDLENVLPLLQKAVE